jgi:RNA polymerase sigma-54 factor
MDYGLKLEMTHKLVMTPQLRQAIAILQLSSLELSEVVEKELLENPVLEIEDKEPGEFEEQQKEPVDSAMEYMDWAEYFNDGRDIGYASSDHQERQNFEAFTPTVVSLEEHLEFQLFLAVLDTGARTVGKYLIGCIDENGYLCCSTEEAAERLNVPVPLVNHVLAVIQTFEPAGVGARDLRECLLIQVRQRNMEDPLVLAVIDRYLDDLGAGKYKSIAEKLGVTAHDIQQAVDHIRTLDPKPGRAFGRSDLTYILPEVVVERVNGNYVITVNDTDVPRLTINPCYRRLADVDNEARKYIESRLNSAVWLIRSIEQRRRTLYNVVAALVDLQRDFFDYGPKHIRPLTMKKLADQVGIHESTVSRAIANKYVDTPHGLFGLRTFFSAGITAAGGEDVAATKVKGEIRELIAGEDAKHPLSDQALTDILNKQGIAVSRRTVAKYREEIGIPASSKRKRY